MKFCKILKGSIEQTLPDWRDKFLCYKDLKKQLKMIYPKEGTTDAGRPTKRVKLGPLVDHDDDDDEAVVETKEVVDFVKLLEKEIIKFNAFFMDKEEEYVIQSGVLKERVKEARSSKVELFRVGQQIVDFYGEVVLLENYSVLNYTGLAKILKKYDKRSGAITRVPFIQKVLQEPFVRFDVLNKLVKECETMWDHLFSLNGRSAPPTEAVTAETNESSKESSSTLQIPEDLTEIEHMENTYLRLTASAYQVLKQIRSGSSTVGVFSLPPMQTNNELEEVWRRIHVVEQEAK
ncbi:OLC1v1032886C2 [Oldenlandia corymbosa var. corymbosa]|nr:OLC1v1032886C2 [Oldenlandia corymbosa var. corymbosa]